MNQEKHKVTLQHWKPVNPDEITKADLPIEGVRVRDNEVTKWSPPKNLTGVKIGEAEMPFIVSHIPWKFCEQLITEELPDFEPSDGLPPFWTRENGAPRAIKGDGMDKRIKGWILVGDKWQHHTKGCSAYSDGWYANEDQSFIPDTTDSRVLELAPEQHIKPETWAKLQPLLDSEDYKLSMSDHENVLKGKNPHSYTVLYQGGGFGKIYPTYQAAAEAILAASEEAQSMGQGNEVSDSASFNRKLIAMYNRGYNAGHEDTVEGRYTFVLDSDLDDYHVDVVSEIIDSPQWEACRAAEEKTPCEQLDSESLNWERAKKIATVQVRLVGMQAENMQRQITGGSMAYVEPDFESLLSILDDGTPVIANPNQQD